jgi:HD superfamily phosphohydrolase YqeK
MSPEQQVEHVVGVTNLAVKLMRAQNFDRSTCACGVALMARIIAGDDLILHG